MPSLAISFALFALLAAGQSGTGEVVGQVVDSSGASVPGARVVIRNTGTGEQKEFPSSETGAYYIPQLIPGGYEVTVEKDGFRRFVQSGLTLQVGQRIRLDVTLQLGAVSESVEVNAQASQLETENASLSQIVENRKILELPLNGRNIVALASLSVGVIPGTGFGSSIPNGRAAITQASMANVTMNGGLAAHNDVLVDGVPMSVCCQNQIAFMLSIDTTEEFRVRTSLYDSQYGRTSGGLITFATKSGSNDLHGSLYHFLRNKNLDATNFFTNRAGQAKGHFVYNQFGARLGGPIRRDRTFFFVNFEGIENRRANNLSGVVPTTGERAGTFTQTVYDPLTGNTRTPFPNNTIPSARINTVSANVIQLYPQANTTGSNNFISNASALDSERQVNARIDHLISPSNRIFGRFSMDNNDGDLPNWYGNIASPGVFNQRVENRNIVVDDTMTLSSSVVMNLRYGFTRQFNRRVPLSLDTDLTKFGWPSSYSQGRQYPTLPTVSLSGFLGLSSNSLFRRAGDVHSGAVSLTRAQGRHFLHFGLDYRVYRTNWVSNNTAAGTFAFNTAFTRGPNAQSGSGGNSAASMLLGYPASGSITILEPFSSPHHYHALYVQDDFRLSSRLTLNAGLRWEVERPRSERYNRLSYFDPDVASPLASATGISNLSGGLQFLGVGGNPTHQQQTDWNNFGPRFGFAYSVNPKTTLRGGYGVTFVPITSRYELASNQGFSATTSFFSSTDGITPVGTFSNPFPGGITQPKGSTPGLLSSIGESFSTMLYKDPVGYNQQWSLTVQREFSSDILLEAGYVGSKGTKLPVPLSINNLPSQYLSKGADLLKTVSNPFQSYAASGTLSGATVTQLQMLKPYPQFLGISTRVDIGSSIYHGFQLRANKRFSNNFSVLASFTAGKTLTDTTPFLVSYLDSAPGYQDTDNRRLDRSIAPQDIARRLAVSYVWQLPFGRGERLLANAPRAVDLILGGWQVNGITTFQGGQPVVITNSISTTSGATRPHSAGRSAKKSGAVDQRLDAYFDTTAFTRPGAYEFGNLSRTLPDVREDGMRNWDVSLFKNYKVREGWNLQFRAEFFNVFNTPRFDGPSGSYGTSTFGVISAQANDPRDVQLALKLVF